MRISQVKCIEKTWIYVRFSQVMKLFRPLSTMWYLEVSFVPNCLCLTQWFYNYHSSGIWLLLKLEMIGWRFLIAYELQMQTFILFKICCTHFLCIQDCGTCFIFTRAACRFELRRRSISVISRHIRTKINKKENAYDIQLLALFGSCKCLYWFESRDIPKSGSSSLCMKLHLPSRIVR